MTLTIRDPLSRGKNKLRTTVSPHHLLIKPIYIGSVNKVYPVCI